jgi:hypothetical protein
MTGEAPRAPQRSLGDRDGFPEWMAQITAALEGRAGGSGGEEGAPADPRPEAAEAPRRRRFLRRGRD